MTGGSTPPEVVVTIGLHSSASTWVFNVVREFMIAAAGEGRVLPLYADEPHQVPDAASRAGRHLVIKSHQGSPGLDTWLAESEARIILSVRDPRDACISMSQRFDAPLKQTARWIANDCNRMIRLAAQGHTKLRYEERFFENPEAAERIAAALGLRLAPTVIDSVFARYCTEAVRSFAQSLDSLPPERLTMIGAFAMDKVTQILSPHIGDTASGKWLSLPDPVQAELTRLFGPFLDRFGYPR